MTQVNANIKQELLDDTQIVQAAALQRAEIETAVATAKKYPRDLTKFKDELFTQATADIETAEDCIYALPRAGTTLYGPSIRLAEIALTAYGNIVVEGIVTGEDEKFVYATGICRDLERNVAVKRTVRRRITNKYGKRYGENEIVATAGAATSIAIRNAIFTIIPAAFIVPAYAACKKIALGEALSLANRRAEVMNKLMKMGAITELILMRIDRAITEDITRDDLEILIGLGTSIKNGDITVDDAFPPKVPVKAKVKDEKPKTKKGKKKENETQKEPAQGSDDIPQGDEPGPITEEKKTEAINKLLDDEAKDNTTDTEEAGMF